MELRPKSFEVLRYLAEHPGRVVSKEEVIAAVWPDVVVTDESLIRCISEVRRAIGDEEQATIKTVPRRGYLFQAQVSARPSLGSASTRLRAGGVVTRTPGRVTELPPLGPRSSCCRLRTSPAIPRRTISATASLRTSLPVVALLGAALIADIRRSTTRDKAIEPGQVARELGVSYVLQGSVRRGRDRVRITAQLTDAPTGTHLWAERYDRALDDLFAIQDEVVRTIAPLLVAHVRKAEVERTLLEAARNLAGLSLLHAWSRFHLAYQSSQEVAALHEARRLFEQSIAIDPAYARPYSALAVSYLSSWTNYGDADFLQSAAWNGPRSSLARPFSSIPS